MNTLPLVLTLTILGSIYLAVLWSRKLRSNDIQATLGIKRKAGPMAVRLEQRDAPWAVYEAPTFLRRGLTLQEAEVPAKKERKPRKAKAPFTKVDQAELTSLFASMQQQAGGFEVIA
ncbi:MAG: hypothetical protein Q8M09_14940 [Pseudomonadota bacterium]|nr:hypothetical protein [Pseudomonadota bacterium]MDP1905520.1 hypothetical protein [Pseudomonadota bacterium]